MLRKAKSRLLLYLTLLFVAAGLATAGNNFQVRTPRSIELIMTESWNVGFYALELPILGPTQSN